MAEVQIKTRAAARAIAPAGLWFDAVAGAGFDTAPGPAPGAIHDPAFHRITYHWRILETPEGGDDSEATYGAPGNMLPVWNRAREAFGRSVALFFPRPGSYLIEVTARDNSGHEARARQALEIADPDAAYPGAATLCVSLDPNETWEGAPPGAERLTSLVGLQRRIGRTPTRLLLRRGQRFYGLEMTIEKGALTHVDAWGAGPAPVLVPGLRGETIFELGKRFAHGQFTLANLDFQGDWDSASETGISPRGPLALKQPRHPGHYTVWNCRVDGFSEIHLRPSDEVETTLLMGNVTITNWRNYGILLRSDRTRFALVGCQIAQHEKALHGDSKTGQLSNNHGPLRISNCAHVYLGVSDFFSRTGWSGLPPARADQPCVRLNTRGVPNTFFTLDRVVCEGGAQMVNMTGANREVVEHPGNYLIDRALLIGTAKSIGPFIAVDFAGLTARNVIGILPDAPRHHGNRWQGALRTRMDSPGPGNAEGPLAVYSCSFVNLLAPERDDRPWAFYKVETPFAEVTLENNLVQAEAAATALDLSQPLPGIRPRFRGLRYGFRPQRGKFARALKPGQGFLLPYGEITEDTEIDAGTGPTNQLYWEALPPGRHMLHVRGLRRSLYSELGQFSVTFARAGVQITNTGEQTWEAGKKWELKLDRTLYLPPLDTRYASPETLPLPRLRPDHPGHQGASSGWVSAWDAFFTPRGAAPSQGAIEP